MKYRDFASFGQVLEDEIFQLPRVLWPKEDVVTEWLTVDTHGEMICLRGFIWDYATVPLTNWISNKIAGIYSVSVTDINACTVELNNLEILENSPIVITDTVPNPDRAYPRLDCNLPDQVHLPIILNED